MQRNLSTIGSTVALVIAVASCGSNDPEQSNDARGTKGNYPRDSTLRMNQLQTKGTHNSFHIEPAGTGIVPWQYTHLPLDQQLLEQGVRAVELDINYEATAQHFEVFHVPTLDQETTCRLFVDCLSALESFSLKNPAHHPIFIQIEPKTPFPTDAVEAYLERFESEILSVFARERIVTPDDVRGDSPTLREAVTGKGWPTLGETRGKVLFFLNETADFRNAYTRQGQNLDGRLMFVESDPSDPFAGVLIINDPLPTIEPAVRDGFIVRTRADSDGVEPRAGDTSRREAAIASGAQIVSTDFPAPVTGLDYWVEIPDGQPSRCNPFSAPAECASTDIENPRFIWH